MDIINCFVAYPSLPQNRAETIERFIALVNEQNVDYLKLTGWKSLFVSGKPIVEEICAAINNCSLFICDLTYLNMNVLFELGYAIAQNKRIWIALDSTIDPAVKNYKRLGLLTTIGFSSYENSYELANKLKKDQPYLDSGATLYERVYRDVGTQNRPPFLFYLKSGFNTDASLELTRRIEDSKIRVVIDYPEEVVGQPLSWYVQNIFYSLGVITHFVSEDRDPTSVLIQNAKYSIVSGVAYGLNKPLLMLAQSPFSQPVDYRDLLYVHETALDCRHKVDEWISKIEDELLIFNEKLQGKRAEIEATISLQRINIGEYVAENEEQELSNYFVPTASFDGALKPTQYLIYVGRKGSGKTANLYQIAQNVSSDKRNTVCIIKPIDYELKGVLRLLNSSISKANPGYLVECLWKFLIYTELGVNLYNQLANRPRYIGYSKEEENFMRFVDENESLIKQDFSLRLEHAIDDLCEVKIQDNVKEQRAKVSEILHHKLLGNLREHLGIILEHKNRVIILLDNLDKAWEKNENVNIFTKFLFGLLSCGATIATEFNKQTIRFKPIRLSLIIFLRSDIFSYIMSNARESDKINFTRLDWNDTTLLQRVIEERFSSSIRESGTEDIWERYFTSHIFGLPTKDYIVSRIIPRPRDMIFFCKNAISNAVNHRNPRIEVADIIQAESNYSEYVFSSLLAETETQFGDMENLLYEFAGGNSTISVEDITKIFGKLNIPIEKMSYAIELLSESNFFGLETSQNNFDFIYEASKKKVIQSMAEKVALEIGIERFRINTPFHSFLEIKEN